MKDAAQRRDDDAATLVKNLHSLICLGCTSLPRVTAVQKVRPRRQHSVVRKSDMLCRDHFRYMGVLPRVLGLRVKVGVREQQTGHEGCGRQQRVLNSSDVRLYRL
jgi:hypothetical protein